MPADGRTRGPARVRERRDIGFAAGQGVQEGEAGAVTQECEKLDGERELLLAGRARVRILRK